MMNKFNEYKKQYEEVFDEIFAQAVGKEAEAVQILVLTGFGSEVQRKNLNSLVYRLGDLITSVLFPMKPSQVNNNKAYQKLKDIGLFEKMCWIYLQTYENDILQSMLLNLFFIIEGKSIDTILKMWKEIYKNSEDKQSRKRKMIKDLLTTSTKWHDEKLLRYQERLELDKIYGLKIGEEYDKYKTVNVRNCFAHGAYYVDAENGNIAFLMEKKRNKNIDENIVEDIFCDNGTYRVSLEKFFVEYFYRILVFYLCFVKTHQCYVEKCKDIWCILQYKKSANSDVPEWSFVDNGNEKALLKSNVRVFKTDTKGGLSFTIPKTANADTTNYYFFNGDSFMDAL